MCQTHALKNGEEDTTGTIAQHLQMFEIPVSAGSSCCQMGEEDDILKNEEDTTGTIAQQLENGVKEETLEMKEEADPWGASKGDKA